MLKHLVLVAFVALLGGCANGYQQFYRPFPGVAPEQIASYRVGPPPAQPMVEHAVYNDELYTAYAKRGYRAIGYSQFTSGQRVTDDQAIEQAKAVGADLVVIIEPTSAGTVTSAMPITMPTTSTTYSSGTATAYGSGGMVNAYGSGTSTTYGTQTMMMPYVIHRTNYGAAYMVKSRVTFGAIVRPLNDSERQAMQTNKGLVVVTVVNDSPAFNADVLPGDVVESFNGRPVPNTDPTQFNQFLDTYRGQRVTVGLLRNGKAVDKDVQFNN